MKKLKPNFPSGVPPLKNWWWDHPLNFNQIKKAEFEGLCLSKWEVARASHRKIAKAAKPKTVGPPSTLVK